ncbi:hypothetical protein V492_05840 [Pseudogymnoascus sp. VKM F-4246]|nr:hypothetical protein V492_05840 [Pseudogymnoascus sp. VKM F-4246]
MGTPADLMHAFIPSVQVEAGTLPNASLPVPTHASDVGKKANLPHRSGIGVGCLSWVAAAQKRGRGAYSPQDRPRQCQYPEPAAQYNIVRTAAKKKVLYL